MYEVHDWTVGSTSPVIHTMGSNAEAVDDDMSQWTVCVVVFSVLIVRTQFRFCSVLGASVETAY
jgi:hypothetical protein